MDFKEKDMGMGCERVLMGFYISSVEPLSFTVIIRYLFVNIAGVLLV
jgi:hypothetical protein